MTQLTEPDITGASHTGLVAHDENIEQLACGVRVDVSITHSIYTVCLVSSSMSTNERVRNIQIK